MAFVVLCWLIKASVDFTIVEFRYGRLAFLEIHTGFLVTIIPVGFSLIAYRFFYRFVNSFSKDSPSANDTEEGLIC